MENNRETFRKQAMLRFRTTALIEDNDNLNYRYRTGFRVLICGDTTKKDLVKKVNKLRMLGFEITLYDKRLDVVLYCEDKNWIYLVELVTFIGSVDLKQLLEITEMTKDIIAGKIFVTVFLDFGTL